MSRTIEPPKNPHALVSNGDQHLKCTKCGDGFPLRKLGAAMTEECRVINPEDLDGVNVVSEPCYCGEAAKPGTDGVCICGGRVAGAPDPVTRETEEFPVTGRPEIKRGPEAMWDTDVMRANLPALVDMLYRDQVFRDDVARLVRDAPQSEHGPASVNDLEIRLGETGMTELGSMVGRLRRSDELQDLCHKEHAEQLEAVKALVHKQAIRIIRLEQEAGDLPERVVDLEAKVQAFGISVPSPRLQERLDSADEHIGRLDAGLTKAVERLEGHHISMDALDKGLHKVERATEETQAKVSAFEGALGAVAATNTARHRLTTDEARKTGKCIAANRKDIVVLTGRIDGHKAAIADLGKLQGMARRDIDNADIDLHGLSAQVAALADIARRGEWSEAPTPEPTLKDVVRAAHDAGAEVDVSFVPKSKPRCLGCGATIERWEDDLIEIRALRGSCARYDQMVNDLEAENGRLSKHSRGLADDWAREVDGLLRVIGALRGQDGQDLQLLIPADIPTAISHNDRLHALNLAGISGSIMSAETEEAKAWNRMLDEDLHGRLMGWMPGHDWAPLISDLQAALRDKPDGWISVDERLPEGNDEVRIWGAEATEGALLPEDGSAWDASHEKDGWRSILSPYTLLEVSHWHPLGNGPMPAPPVKR
jgi:predicted  nucleic acid-binding Zn-ribbon protein